MGYNEGDFWLDNLPAYRAWKAKKDEKDMTQVEPVTLYFTLAFSVEESTFKKLLQVLKSQNENWQLSRINETTLYLTFQDWKLINILNQKRIPYTLVDQVTRV